MIAKDKQLHLLAGFIIALCIVWITPFVALVTVIVIGILKELWDKRHGGTVDGWDVIATILGGLPACLFKEIFNYV